MKSMNRNGKTWWLVDLNEHEDLHRRIQALKDHHLLHPGEGAFVDSMASKSASRSFTLSNPQAQWLDKIMARCGQGTIFPGIV